MKEKNKKISVLLFAMLIVLSVSSACSKSESTVQDSPDISNSETSNAEKTEAPLNTENTEPLGEAVKSDGYEKFTQLKIGMTESEVNAILGEPAKVDKAYYYYNVIVNGQEAEVQVWINTTSGLVTYISGDFNEDEYRAEFADSATDLSSADDLDSGKLSTYEACADAFKTPGYLIGIDEDGENRYLWVDSNDGHMCIAFDADGNVKSYVGYC